ncbi:MAG: hypothetical protein IKO84_00950 [Butyrivibrio sp.]|nr:hypothetical protein [Butyrivibrio sp.]
MAASLAFCFVTVNNLPIIAYAETTETDPTGDNDLNDTTEKDDASTLGSTSEDISKDTISNENEESATEETKKDDLVSEEKKSDEQVEPKTEEDPSEEAQPEEGPEATPAETLSDINPLKVNPAEAPIIEYNRREIPMQGWIVPTTYSQASFYILNEIDSDIPEEPTGHPDENYSDAITIAEAIPNDFRYYAPIVDGNGSEESLADDNFTAKNSVISYLHNYPTAEDIKNVVPSFDPEKQYVIWYVKKLQGSSIHVDGVIKTRAAYEELVPGRDYPNVSIEIYTTCEEMDIEYDGKEHVIGGFNIVVKDLDHELPTLRNIFDALGNFLTVEAYAGTNGEGTYFSSNGINYWVNIDAAYVVASEIKTYTIPFLFNGKEIAPEDISVSFEKDGEWLKLPASVIAQQKPTTAKVNVKQRELTLEAGTTVKNYDGSVITNDKVNITSGSLLEGHRLKNVVIHGSQSVVGSSKNEIMSYLIVDENGKDVTSLYNVKCIAGKLEFVDDGSYEGSENKDPNNLASIAIKDNVTEVIMEKNSADVAVVLGASKKMARMGQTGDDTDIIARILTIIAACTAIAILASKKRSQDQI